MNESTVKTVSFPSYPSSIVYWRTCTSWIYRAMTRNLSPRGECNSFEQNNISDVFQLEHLDWCHVDTLEFLSDLLSLQHLLSAKVVLLRAHQMQC